MKQSKESNIIYVIIGLLNKQKISRLKVINCHNLAYSPLPPFDINFTTYIFFM